MRGVFLALITGGVFCAAWAQPPSVPGTPTGSTGKDGDKWFTKKGKPQNTSIRDLAGTVMTSDRQPVSGALVRLVETNSGTARELVTDGKGAYRFSGLKRDLIYQVSAQYKGQKTNTRSLTPFDERDEPNLDLTMATPKKAPAKESKK